MSTSTDAEAFRRDPGQIRDIGQWFENHEEHDMGESAMACLHIADRYARFIDQYDQQAALVRSLKVRISELETENRVIARRKRLQPAWAVVRWDEAALRVGAGGMSFKVEQFNSRVGWLRGRQSGIGASDAAAVVGLSSYHSAYGLWVAKSEPLVIEEPDELAYWGTRLEPVIAEEFWRQAKDAILKDFQCA
jgi:hypothetical protein